MPQHFKKYLETKSKEKKRAIKLLLNTTLPQMHIAIWQICKLQQYHHIARAKKG